MTEASVSIEFAPTGAGWAALHIRTQGKTFTIEGVSYTTDVLGDLLRAALMVATGALTARASFDGEPMETRLIVGPVWDSSAWRKGFWIRLLTFQDIYDNEPDENGHLVFETVCEKGAFIAAAVAAANNYLTAHGNEPYDWGGNSFPAKALKALEALLDNP